MRGDKFIDGSSAQSGTVFAGRLGGGAFRLRNRWTHAMTIGTNGSTRRGYFRAGGWGNLAPDSWSGVAIDGFYAINSNLGVLEFAGGAQIAGVTQIRIKSSIPGAAGAVMSWDGANNYYDAVLDPAIFAYLDANVGEQISLRFGKVS